MNTVSSWVQRFLPLVSPGGQILDVACGGGRNMRLAHALGYRVTGVDRDVSKVQDMATTVGISLIARDLEDGSAFPYLPASFDGVVVTNYLWRPILAAIIAAVKPEGVLIYETFAVGNAAYGRPSNPEFLLRPNELLDAVVSRLHVVAFEHATLDEPKRMVQRIVAVGRSRLPMR